MKKLKEIWFYDDIYKRNYVFYIGKQEDAIKRYKKYFKVELPKGKNGEGKIWGITNYGYVIWLPRFSLTPKWLSVLAHEIMHAVLFTMKEVHIKFNDNNPEPITYYTEFLTKKFLQGYESKKSKTKMGI